LFFDGFLVAIHLKVLILNELDKEFGCFEDSIRLRDCADSGYCE
jgi:hypothetical protein